MEYLTDSTTVDDVFDALRNPYRRRILIELSDHGAHTGDVVSLDEIATDDEDLTDLRTQLHHCHLPKLATNGYIEWNPDAGRIRQGTNFEEITPFLAVVLEHEDELSAEGV